MTNNSLRMYVIYDHPSDYPNCFVIRLWKDGQPTVGHMLTNTLEGARRLIPKGLHCIPRDPTDDPVIVESWL